MEDSQDATVIAHVYMSVTKIPFQSEIETSLLDTNFFRTLIFFLDQNCIFLYLVYR